MRTSIFSLSLLWLVGCYTSQPASDAPSVGRLVTALKTTGPDGSVYRLREARFTISGPTGAVLTTETDPTANLLTAELNAGDYQILLQSGWRLEKEALGIVADVQAELVSPNPAAFSIMHQEVTAVAYRFHVDTGTVIFAPGNLVLSIQVEGVAAASCNLLGPSGCESGSKCWVALDDAAALPHCVPTGSVMEGNICAPEPMGDVCQAGTACAGGECRRYCDRTVETADCYCAAVGGSVGLSNVGICSTPCDPLLQDCAAGEGCYTLLTEGASICARTPSSSGGQGERCDFLNECDRGLGCLLLEDDHVLCAKFCNAAGRPPACGAGLQCAPVNDLFGDLGYSDDLGACTE